MVEKEEERHRGCKCRPLGFLLGLPVAFCALHLSLPAAFVWILGSMLSCCPCMCCCAGLANKAMYIIKLPLKVMQWFMDCIPC